jgi:hypothetical protein
MGLDTIFRRVLAENPGVNYYHRSGTLLVADVIDILEDAEASTDDLKNVLARIGAALYTEEMVDHFDEMVDHFDDLMNPGEMDPSDADLAAHWGKRPVPIVPVPEHPRITYAKASAQNYPWTSFARECLEAAERFKTLGSDDAVTADDDEPVLYQAHAFIGSYAATPSGKVYAPFAAGNLEPCPECGGTGKVAPRTARELFLCREMSVVNEARPETPEGYDFKSPEWAAWVERLTPLVRQGVQRDGGMNLDCPLCEDGFHEPVLDAAWRKECEAQATSLGSDFYFDEQDGDYYLVMSFTHDGEGEE